MFKKIAVALIIGSLVVAGSGCAKKNESPQSTQNNQPSSQTQLPPGHPGADGSQSGQPAKSAKPVNAKEVADKVAKDLDAKFPGNWSVSGTTLKKGTYTENGNYKIGDKVASLYNNSMVSIFVGQDRISSTVKDQTGKPVLSGYPTPDTVAKVMTSGEPIVTSADSMGSTSYQKVFLPIKANSKTVAVMSISIAQ